MPRLFLATSNRHKTTEVAAILGSRWQIEDLTAHPGITLPEETGDTFEANAVIKANGASLHLPDVWVLADDSGLEVDALKGAPGVHSARYAGPGASDVENRKKLKNELRVLAANPGQSFVGRFRCCMALVRSGALLKVTHGTVEGRVVFREQGTGGFGYDSLFIPNGHKDTFGVLSETLKNRLSHRAAALRQMREWLDAHMDEA